MTGPVRAEINGRWHDIDIDGDHWNNCLGCIEERQAPMTERTADLRRDPTAVNHWEDYGGVHPGFECDKEVEFCTNCGRQMVESIEPGTLRSRRTGGPTFARYHSCPTWVEGWRTSTWARGWALPGYGHDSHDADNPLSSRGYR